MSEGDSAFDVARKTIYWTLIMFVIVMVFLAFWFTIGNFKQKAVYLPLETKAELLSQRFTSSVDCFAYKDPLTDKVNVGTIDITKFTEAQLDRCYLIQSTKEINFQLVLEYVGGEKVILKTDKWYDHIDLPLPSRTVRIVSGPNAETEGRLWLYVQEKI